MVQYDLVIGVDRAHMPHLEAVWGNWGRVKPSVLDRRVIIFYDEEDLREEIVRIVGDHPIRILWNPGCTYTSYGDRWSDPQRQKMLAGFPFVAAAGVLSPYWLKLDLDVVASRADSWVDPQWFDRSPAIIAHRWSYTKPANQMLDLDMWANVKGVTGSPLNLVPKEGASLVSHPRIISWCAFFNTEFTRECVGFTDTYGKLPVPSQDGFMWYMATRLGREVRRVNMKRLGWVHRSKLYSVQEAIKELKELG